jgi:hypothetical protein
VEIVTVRRVQDDKVVLPADPNIVRDLVVACVRVVDEPAFLHKK